MTHGIVMFGLNNHSIDYLKLCTINALFIRVNMGRDIPITVITSEFSLTWSWAVENKELIDKVIDNLIVLEKDGGLKKSTNYRIFRDTQYYTRNDVFLNASRVDAFSLSPYDETLLIDCDYLILSDSLNAVWGSKEDFQMTNEGIHLSHGKFDFTEWRLNPYGIRNYWGGVIYFQKTERVQMIFELVRQIRDNWTFYSLVYGFPSGLYRNDFAFSIAIHMISGFQENDDVKPIIDSPILNSIDRDQLIDIIDPTKLIFFVKNLSDAWSFSLQKIHGINVHVSNKLALLNKSEKILKVLKSHYD
jgi:hypothetical protein